MFSKDIVIDEYNKSRDLNRLEHSYDYCCEAFERIRDIEEPTDEDYDLMALHLGMFLASWGMMRKSSKISRLSYVVHVDAIKMILDVKYRGLFNISPLEMDDEQIKLIDDLGKGLKKYYHFKDYDFLRATKTEGSDTLATKILMVTLRCSVAIDKEVKKALRNERITLTFGKRHLKKLQIYCRAHRDEINDAVNAIKNPKYNVFKCLDMFFFNHPINSQESSESVSPT